MGSNLHIIIIRFSLTTISVPDYVGLPPVSH